MSDAKKNITIGFNIALLIYFVIITITDYLFEPEPTAKVPWESLFGTSQVLSIGLAIILIGILIVTGAYLIKLFWNRFISDIAKLREISFQEAMALVLIIGIFFS